MQKFPLRNRGDNRRPNDSTHGGIRNRPVKRNRSPREISQPQRMQRICELTPAAVTHQSSTTTKSTTGKICSRAFTKEAANLATWDEVLSVGSKSKSLLSPVTSSLVESNAVTVAATRARAQEPVQQTSASAEILEVAVPNKATASGNNIANDDGNRNKDDDDNSRSRRQHQQRTTALPAASVREFMTSERLRLGDQINFLLFDPYRTLKFLITELKSRLRTVVPDDINVQKILVEIQQTMKRIRIPNVTESLPPLPLQTTAPTANREEGPKTATECILPKERCHVIKKNPLINHGMKVNSSCQTIELQLENVSSCQMCEHQVKQGTAGEYNQKRVYSSVEDVITDGPGTHQRSKDHGRDIEMGMHLSCRSLQDDIANLKIKSNPFSDDTQKIITQTQETELSNFQCKLKRTTSSTSSSLLHRPSAINSTTEQNSKVQCKRLPDEGTVQDEDEEQVLLDFIAKSPLTQNTDSTNQAAALVISKQSQTNLQSPTQMFCHLEKEKLLLLHQFRTSEMETIQGDLDELHAFIKDQLDGIYQSIAQENQNLKHHSNDKGGRPNKAKKNHRQKISRTLLGPEKTTKLTKVNKTTENTPTTAAVAAASASLTVPTSSVLSFSEVGGTTSTRTSSVSPGHYKKSPPSPVDGNDDDIRNANNNKSITKPRQHQKSSSSSLSTADAKKNHDISDVDKANKAFGVKNSKDDSYRRRRHNLCCADVDTPICSGKKMNFTAVECEGCCSCPHTRMDHDDDSNNNNNKVQRMRTAADATRTPTHCDIKSTMKTSPATMTCHQHRQQCHQQPMTTMTMTAAARTSAAQEQTQLISSAAVPSYITRQSTTDETALNPDTVTNARVKAIIGTTRAAPEHSDGIRWMHKQQHYHHHHQQHHRRCQSYQAHNSWQRVNLKNPTGCQLKKQICGDGYECRINNNSNSNGNSDNRSNYPEIHDCQKCRANSINPSAGLRSAKMHEVGTDDGHIGRDDDGGAGGDGPIYWDKGNGTRDFTCHIGQRKQAEKLHSRRRHAAKAAIQIDLGEFKQFLDEIILPTPRLK